jgi:alpha-tubulin suppressor-like RCC1 family protein
MGRGNVRAINREWVPILNPVTVNYGRTTTPDANVYDTFPELHGLQDYDVIKSASDFYVVKVLSSTTFQLYKNDSLSNADLVNITLNSNTQVHKRMGGISNAAFGGTGSNTFGYLQTTDGTLYAWGYGANTGHLGNGSIQNKNLPTIVPSTIGSEFKSQTVYTGLDYTVHYVSVSGRLFACGNNNLGQLGIGKNRGFETQFVRIEVANLIDTGLPITANNYTVDKFFSPGTDCRFCIFQSGTAKKFTAWGSNPYNKLGGDNNSTTYTRPQAVYVDNDSNVVDVQTTAILGGNTDLTTIMIQDQDQDYGNVYTCGFHHYNINNVPYRTVVPFFTKVTNI